eukprot:TRINITY_DN74009_c0_g1_i1.p1 TRINITY_DN74009_c0_g1~~TRINITY_DN74009_c0_g1_i1.p1  ORF type:complete len:196 (-),score=10.65 TRINITY_DN74009_c0_g1_i1:120-707(-)
MMMYCPSLFIHGQKQYPGQFSKKAKRDRATTNKIKRKRVKIEEKSGTESDSGQQENLIRGSKEVDNRSKNLLEKVKQKVPGLRIAIPKDPVGESSIITPNLYPLKPPVPSVPSPIPLSPHRNLQSLQSIVMSAQMGFEGRIFPLSSQIRNGDKSLLASPAPSPGGIPSAFRQYESIVSPLFPYRPFPSIDSAKKT